jgi:hypothetical protein
MKLSALRDGKKLFLRIKRLEHILIGQAAALILLLVADRI